MTDIFPKSLFVDGSDLFQKDHRILYNMIFFCADLYMRRQFCLIHFRCDSGADHSRAMSVSHIILNDQNRTDPALL